MERENSRNGLRPRLLPRWLAIVLGTLTIAFAVLGVWIGIYLHRFYATNAAYERMVESNPRTLSEVARALPDFNQTVVSEPSGMVSNVASRLPEGGSYVRFFRWKGLYGLYIDVIVDQKGKVIGYWPTYN